jgi:glycine C-acetyltransferase
MNLLDKALSKLGPLGSHAYYAHGYFAYPRLEGELGNKMIFNGKEKLVWSINNYLGLANNPAARKSDEEGVKQYGLAYPMGARMMTGNSSLHELLEKKISGFVHKQDTFLLNYGYQGMLSIIDSLVDRHDIIIYDSESHACIIDGCRLHAGKRFVFKHNDMEDFEKQLKRAEKLTEIRNGGILVITEGVFGMSGDMGKLKEIALFKKTHNFTLLVDDAHGIGVMGETGAGTGELQGVQDSIDLYFGTFAKAFAAIGAFVSGKKEVIQYLRYNMRSQIYAKALPMAVVFGLHQRLQLIKEQPELRTKLWEITGALQAGLRATGLDIGNTESPVTPVYLRGSIKAATRLVEDLRENYNIFCSMVVYPVIPQGIIMLRLIPTAIHTFEDVYKTIEAFAIINQNLDDGGYEGSERPSYSGDQILSSNLDLNTSIS